MKTPAKKPTTLVILMILMLSVCAVKSSAQLNIDMKNVGIHDTVYTCDNIMTLTFFPDTLLENSWWIVIETENGEWLHHDTILYDTLSLYDFREGTVRHDSWNETDFYQSSIEVRPLKLNTSYIAGDCNTELQLFANTNFTGQGNISYSWEPAELVSDPHIANPTAQVTGNADYTVSLVTPTGCNIFKTQEVLMDAPLKPSICIVSVDSMTVKNILYWETPLESGLDSIFIFRETDVSGEYKKIGGLPMDNPGFFIDNGSNPLVQSNKYKLALMDSCENLSDYSDSHKTMHLAINPGANNTWNLIWEPYEGFNVSTYRIFRAHDNGPMELIGTTSGSSTQYTDFSAPSGNVHYQIEVVNPSACNITGLKSTQSIINKTRSNIASNEPAVLTITRIYRYFSVYPNPFESMINIESNITDPDGYFELTGLDGMIIKRGEFNTHKIEVEVNDIKPGSYVLKIHSGDEIHTSLVFKR